MQEPDKKITGTYKRYLKDNLSKKRYTHSLNVADAALVLADKYHADSDKCYIAGLLHDIAKELPIEKQFEYVESSNLSVSEAEKSITPVFHAIAGAEIVDQLFNIKDKDIKNSIRYHTVARSGMSLVEQIIYIADLISADRDYKDVKKMRKYALISMDKAMYEALKYSVESSIDNNNIIPVSTIEAYNEYVIKNNNNLILRNERTD